MEDWQYIVIFIFIVFIAVGITLGLFLTKYAMKIDDDEEYESEWLNNSEDRYKDTK